MAILAIIISALIPVVGGLLTAIALCLVTWNLLKLVRHPEFGPLLGLVALGVLLSLGARVSQVLVMAAAFLFVPATLLWPEGARWRHRHP